MTFSVAAGQTVALVGRSGGGKTTMTHLIARLYDATSGTVSVAGTDVKKLKQNSLRATVGYVTQDAHMFHDTIRANLRYAQPDATDAELWEALEAAQLNALVESLPDGWTRWWASAATGCPVGSGSVLPLPGCCSRPRPSWCSTRPPRIWTQNPKSLSSKRWIWRWRAYQHRHRTPAVDDPQRRLDHRRGPGPDRAARPARGADARGWAVCRALPHPVRSESALGPALDRYH